MPDNKFFIGSVGNKLIISHPPLGPIEKEEALNLAAWIVALCPEKDFDKILESVYNS